MRSTERDTLIILIGRLKLKPEDSKVYERLVTTAFAAKRYGIAVDAEELAIRANRWPLPELGSMKISTAADLRALLYRGAVARDRAGLGSRIPEPALRDENMEKKTWMPTPYDTQVEYGHRSYDRALAKPDGPAWVAIVDVLTGPARADKDEVEFGDKSTGRIVLQGNCHDGWNEVARFEMPGAEPIEAKAPEGCESHPCDTGPEVDPEMHEGTEATP